MEGKASDCSLSFRNWFKSASILSIRFLSLVFLDSVCSKNCSRGDRASELSSCCGGSGVGADGGGVDVIAEERWREGRLGVGVATIVDAAVAMSVSIAGRVWLLNSRSILSVAPVSIVFS